MFLRAACHFEGQSDAAHSSGRLHCQSGRLHFHIHGCSSELRANSETNQMLHIHLNDFTVNRGGFISACGFMPTFLDVPSSCRPIRSTTRCCTSSWTTWASIGAASLPHPTGFCAQHADSKCNQMLHINLDLCINRGGSTLTFHEGP